jgi:DNA-binding NarL/FixJ family response regulator
VNNPPSVDDNRLTSLTAREWQVLDSFESGATYVEVARELSISVNTVREYVRNIYRKLQVSSKTEAVLTGLAIRRDSAGLSR